MPFLFFCIYLGSALVKTRVLSTSILHFAPNIKMHHIVLLSNNPCNGIYILDFSPINQTSSKTLMNLLLAKNVPGEIRLRNIKDFDFFDNDDKIINFWSHMKTSDNLASINDKEVQERIAYIMESWKPGMNLYTHNCQHFSKFVQKQSK